MHPRMRNKVYEVGMLVLAFFMVFGLIMFLGKNVKAETMIPANQGYVTDQTGILSPSEKQRVERRLSQFERSRPDRPQFVVLIVKDLPDQGIEQFSTDVFRKWGVGQKGIDNGALWVVHPKADNHADVRLEIGRGLEGAFPDSYASRINREVAGPLWTKGQHGDAIIAIADRLAKDMDPVGKIPDTYYQQVSKPQGRSWLGILFGLILFTAGIILLLRLARRRKRTPAPAPAPRNMGGQNTRVRTDAPPADPYLSQNLERLRKEREQRERNRLAEAERLAQEQRRSDASKMARSAPSRGSGAAAGLAAGAAGVAIGMAAEEAMNRRRREQERAEEEAERRRRRDRDDSSSYSGYSSGLSSGSSSSSSGSSSSSSDSGSYSSGGGDSGGGGSSDSF